MQGQLSRWPRCKPPHALVHSAFGFWSPQISRPKSVGQKFAQLQINFRRAVTNANNPGILPEFINHLTARPTRGAWDIGWRIHDHCQNPFHPIAPRVENGVALGAYRESKRCVFDVATGVNFIRVCQHSRANRKVAVRTIGLLACLPGKRNQLCNARFSDCSMSRLQAVRRLIAARAFRLSHLDFQLDAAKFQNCRQMP